MDINVTESGERFLDYSTKTLKEIIQIFQDMLERADQQELYKHAEELKAAFYKVLKKEKIAAGFFEAALYEADGDATDTENAESESAKTVEIADGAEAAEEASIEAAEVQETESAPEEAAQESVSNNPFAELEKGFKSIYTEYKRKRAAYLEEMEKVKEENYKQKLQIIEELKALLERAEDVNSTFPTFRELQSRWKSISAVPQAKAKELWDSYQHCVEMFYDYIKINNEFRDLDFKKNLELKAELCERAEALENEPSVVNAFKELQKLHEEWKEIGPVAKEFRESIWERFKTITSAINKKHQSFFENMKNEQKENLAKKSALCEKAEAIAAQESGDSGLWNSLTKQMDAIQAEWKTIGFASKKENQKIYDRFRAACDKFYGAKREFYANFKNVMQDNLSKKEALCEQAEAIAGSEDWKKTSDRLIALQKQWREIGPVARKQSDVVWKRFRAACDKFFERKASHFGNIDEKYDENLVAKRALIEEVKAYTLSDSKDENISVMREFQNRWNEIGFVPFKEKEKIQKEWNAAMDMHFADIRSLESEKQLNRFIKKVSDIKSSGKGDRSLRIERDKLLQKYKKCEQDIATLENNVGFFAKSKGADAFIEEINKKIMQAKEELARIEEKIKVIDNQF